MNGQHQVFKVDLSDDDVVSDDDFAPDDQADIQLNIANGCAQGLSAGSRDAGAVFSRLMARSADTGAAATRQAASERAPLTASIPADPQGRVTLLFDLNGVLIMAKVDKPPSADGKRDVFTGLHSFVARQGLTHLLTLLPHFRLGLYTSATLPTLKKRLKSLEDYIWRLPGAQAFLQSHNYCRSPADGADAAANSARPAGAPRPIFELLLHRNHCRPDPHWNRRAEGRAWDTVKPIALHGLDLRRTVLIDDSARKSLPDEAAGLLVVPTFDPRTVGREEALAVVLPEGRLPLLRLLAVLLRSDLGVLGADADVRTALPLLRLHLEEAINLSFCACLQAVADSPHSPVPVESPAVFQDPSPPEIMHCPPIFRLPASFDRSTAVVRDSYWARDNEPALQALALPSVAHVGSDSRPLILFELTALVHPDCPSLARTAHQAVTRVLPRRGLEHLLSLVPFYRLGIYTTLPAQAAWAVLHFLDTSLWEGRQGQEHLASAGHLGPLIKHASRAHVFEVVLSQGHCHRGHPDAPWSKPLALHGIDASRCVLVDTVFRDSAAPERECTLVLPDAATAMFEDSESELNASARRLPVLRVLCTLLRGLCKDGDASVHIGRDLTALRTALASAAQFQAVPELAGMQPLPPRAFDSPLPCGKKRLRALLAGEQPTAKKPRKSKAAAEGVATEASGDASVGSHATGGPSASAGDTVERGPMTSTGFQGFQSMSPMPVRLAFELWGPALFSMRRPAWSQIKLSAARVGVTDHSAGATFGPGGNTEAMLPCVHLVVHLLHEHRRGVHPAVAFMSMCQLLCPDPATGKARADKGPDKAPCRLLTFAQSYPSAHAPATKAGKAKYVHRVLERAFVSPEARWAVLPSPTALLDSFVLPPAHLRVASAWTEEIDVEEAVKELQHALTCVLQQGGAGPGQEGAEIADNAAAVVASAAAAIEAKRLVSLDELAACMTLNFPMAKKAAGPARAWLVPLLDQLQASGAIRGTFAGAEDVVGPEWAGRLRPLASVPTWDRLFATDAPPNLDQLKPALEAFGRLDLLDLSLRPRCAWGETETWRPWPLAAAGDVSGLEAAADPAGAHARGSADHPGSAAAPSASGAGPPAGKSAKAKKRARAAADAAAAPGDSAKRRAPCPVRGPHPPAGPPPPLPVGGAHITPWQQHALSDLAALPLQGPLFAHPDTVAPIAAAAGLSPLHFEVYEFAIKAAPQPRDIADVAAVLKAIDKAAKQCFSGARAVLFGSQPTGLSLPSSDLDVVILGALNLAATPAAGYAVAERRLVSKALGKISKAMASVGLHSQGSAQVIAGAKVPIIKTTVFVPGGSGRTVLVDISMGMKNGAQAVHFAQRQLQAMPPLRPLVLLLKAFLKQRQLNEVMHGGLSSYSLLNMVIAHLQVEGFQPAALIDSTQVEITYDVDAQLEYARMLATAAASATVHDAAQWQGMDLGTLLLGFLWRFGMEFDYNQDGVSIRQGGIVSRAEAGGQLQQQGLALEDPQEAGRSIGAGSHNIASVGASFHDAWNLLSAGVADWEQGQLQPVSDAALWSQVQASGSHSSEALPRPSISLLLDCMCNVVDALDRPVATQSFENKNVKRLRVGGGKHSMKRRQLAEAPGMSAGVKKDPKKVKKPKKKQHKLQNFWKDQLHSMLAQAGEAPEQQSWRSPRLKLG